MRDNERKIIQKLMSKSLSKKNFIKSFTVDINKNKNYIIQLLEAAYNEKNADDVEYVLFIGFVFNLFTKEFLCILCTLIEASWHYSHEDIASILQSLKDPQSIECLYKTAITEFEYLDYDESYALAVKCIWALGAINNSDSRKKLELLSQSNNEIIRNEAIKQLDRNY